MNTFDDLMNSMGITPAKIDPADALLDEFYLMPNEQENVEFLPAYLLDQAIQQGNIEGVDMCLAFRSKIGGPLKDVEAKMTLLGMAILKTEKGPDLEIVKALVTGGADINESVYCVSETNSKMMNSPLMQAFSRGKWEIGLYLAAQGADKAGIDSGILLRIPALTPKNDAEKDIKLAQLLEVGIPLAGYHYLECIWCPKKYPHVQAALSVYRTGEE